MSDRIDLEIGPYNEYVATLERYINEQWEAMVRTQHAKDNLANVWRDAAYRQHVDDLLRALIRVEQGLNELKELIPGLKQRGALAQALADLR